MSFLSKVIFVLLIVFSASAETNRLVLRVAADPNNLPFSNDKLEGFENRIAKLIAGELNADLKYVWRAQRRGFFRETLKANEADLVMGVPAEFDPAAPTKPYFTSTYVFVTRTSDNLKLETLDDPRLRTLRVGVQMVGDDYGNTPPALALAQRGIVTNVLGFTLYGDYREPNPPAAIISAVERGNIDVALVWGPFAGYFAGPALDVRPIRATPGDPQLTFSIAIGCRRKDRDLLAKVNEILAKDHDKIAAILTDYRVPKVEK